MDLQTTRDKLAVALKQCGTNIVFAESCTAGLCSATMGQVDGISAHLSGSAVTYRSDTKLRWLGVRSSTIDEHSSESVQIAEEMALGVLEKTPEADWATAVVGHLADGQEPCVCISIVRREDNHAREPVKHVTIVRPLRAESRLQRQLEATQIVLETLWQAVQKKSK